VGKSVPVTSARAASGKGCPIGRPNAVISCRRSTVDWGDGPKGYSPIDLVAAALGCSPGEAFVWLADMVDPIPEHINTFNPQPKETAELERLAASPVNVSSPPLDRADELLTRPLTDPMTFGWKSAGVHDLVLVALKRRPSSMAR
jgi:hypothetical protein